MLSLFIPPIPTYLKIPLYTAILALTLITTVPKNEIRRLAVYGIIFGAISDIIALTTGKLFGLFEYVNFAPLGYWVIPFFSPIAWAIYFVMYFYFMPKHKPLMYIYAASGIGYGTFFAQLLFNSGIMVVYPKFFSLSVHRLIDPIFVFLIWFPISTWGFIRLTSHFEGQKQSKKVHEKKRPMGLKLYPQPARKTKKKARN